MHIADSQTTATNLCTCVRAKTDRPPNPIVVHCALYAVAVGHCMVPSDGGGWFATLPFPSHSTFDTRSRAVSLTDHCPLCCPCMQGTPSPSPADSVVEECDFDTDECGWDNR